MLRMLAEISYPRNPELVMPELLCGLVCVKCLWRMRKDPLGRGLTDSQRKIPCIFLVFLTGHRCKQRL